MSCRVRLLSLPAVVLLALPLASPPLRAQGKPGPGDDAKVVLPVGGTDKLQNEVKTSKHYHDALPGLWKGTIQPSDANKDVIETAAKWYVYRVTWPWLHSGDGQMDGLYKEFDRELTVALTIGTKTKADNSKFLQQLTHQMVGCLKEVLQNDRAIARINGARILARLASAQQEEVGDLLAATLNDPNQLEAVKFYAARGMGNMFAWTRGENRIRLRDEERERHCIQALLDYYSHKPSLSASAAPEELAAVHYVRREALHALGETRHPAVVSKKEPKSTATSGTAWLLARVLRNDGIEPPPDIAEQVEAAVALCQLEAELMPDYQADYAATQLGRFLVEYSQRVLEDRGEKSRKEPWNLHTARLLHALDDLQNNTRRILQVGPYVGKFVAQARPLLDNLANNRDPQATNLNNWLNQNPPAGKSIYKSVDSSVVKAPEKAAE